MQSTIPMRHAPSMAIDGMSAPTRVATRIADPREIVPGVDAETGVGGTGANVCVRGMIRNGTSAEVFMGRPIEGASCQVSAASRW